LSDKINLAIEQLQKAMDEEGIDPTQGLPQELFHFATSLIPCANIDLFITDDKKRLLLTWRDDEFYGKGWHIPGGCLRLKESLDYRIQETARSEIGTTVFYDKSQFITREGIIDYEHPWMTNQLIRSHNISMLFFCHIPDNFCIENISNGELSSGDAKWFECMPEDLLFVHRALYGDIIENYFKEVLM